MAIRKHESSQSCKVCVCGYVGCNGSLCCCEGIRRTESNTSEKECAAECQCKEQSERATERESALGNTLSLECALSSKCALFAVRFLCYGALSTLLSVVCIGIHTLWNETHHNHAPLGQLSPLGAASRGSAGSAAAAAAAACPKMKSAHIFLLYFKLLMSGLFSY